jgi:hypothetical protein
MPLLVYAFSATTSQNIPTSGSIDDSIIKWPTGGKIINNSSSTGISFNSTTGIFTNGNSYSIIVAVSLNVGYGQGNSVGIRVSWLQHTVGTNTRLAGSNVLASTDYSTLSISATFILLAGEGFYANTYQTSGVTQTIGGSNQDPSPTRISILVL